MALVALGAPFRNPPSLNLGGAPSPPPPEVKVSPAQCQGPDGRIRNQDVRVQVQNPVVMRQVLLGGRDAVPHEEPLVVLAVPERVQDERVPVLLGVAELGVVAHAACGGGGGKGERAGGFGTQGT